MPRRTNKPPASAAEHVVKNQFVEVDLDALASAAPAEEVKDDEVVDPKDVEEVEPKDVEEVDPKDVEEVDAKDVEEVEPGAVETVAAATVPATSLGDERVSIGGHEFTTSKPERKSTITTLDLPAVVGAAGTAEAATGAKPAPRWSPMPVLQAVAATKDASDAI